MTARTRADLAALPSYVPGRAIEGAIKLASNEVPGGPLPSVAKAIADATALINRYPDSGATELIAMLSARLGVPAEQISAGCGSVTLFQQLVQAMCTEADTVVYPWRSFEAYPIIVQVVGAQQVQVPLHDDQSLNLDALLAAITPETRMVVVCTPNNPTGTAVRREPLTRFLDAVPDNVLVVIDEAYREFVTDPEVPDGVELAKEYWAKGRDVAVLRTFSKAYGLAGLRVGYLVAPPEVTDAVRKVFVPFGVNALAQVAAIASLEAADELLERCKEIIAERSRVHAALTEAGYDVPPTQANFVWLPLGDRALEFAEHCLTHKVIVRPFKGDGVRVTIGTPAENDTFLTAATTFVR
ncbi:histidinol-phosphate transaminase [Labedaea rhizosphaerae]|uniref:Aromatic amino acid aminotransferase n=1 Tax=Labedaea rhizosphaerae TaxID=598644 RepID=A0A4R6SL79_LABRH|nr:histidinol-phosphate transaminase [Labedaea rhizosphaerae]TDQ04948.1 histidinol-phosphate aminotransferase [Labedaea rhizosphaerae]